ncbi:MAG: hypothetical protein ACYCVA_03735 [Sulfobacillus sp.]
MTLKRLLWRLGLLAVFTLTLAGSMPRQAAAASPPTRHVIVVLVNDTSIQNWAFTNLPVLRQLVAQGALGLMNSNTSGQSVPPNGLLTLASSAHMKTVGPELSVDASGTYHGLSVSSLYLAEFGHLPPPGSVVSLDAGQNQSLNAANPYSFTMGALAQQIMAAGGTTAVFGNADQPFSLTADQWVFDRSGALVAENSQGIATRGNVGDNLLHTYTGAPFGVALNNQLLLQDVVAAYPKTTMTVIDYGDTVRANLWRHFAVSSPVANAATAFALHHFDSFLGQLLPYVNRQNTMIVVVSAAPSDLAVTEHESLTPLLVVAPGYQPGVLSSGTTHRYGIVSNIDVAPTILQFLGVSVPTDFFGRPTFSLPATHTLSYLSALGSRLAFQSFQRLPVLKTLVYYIVLVFLAAIGYVLFSRRSRPRLKALLNATMISVMYLPVAILLAPLASPMSVDASFSAIIGFTAIATLATVYLSRNALDRIWAPCLLTSIVLMIDLLTGAHLIKNSALGYDPQIGARYYGIGNEYMGAWIGAACIGFTALLDRARRSWLIPVVIVFFLAIIAVMVTPDLGTKAGGAITATAAFGILILLITGRKVGLKEVAVIGGAIIVLLLALVVGDITLHSAASRTDIGRAGLLIVSGGPQQALLIIVRKLGTDMSLIQGSYWTLLFLVALAILVTVLTVLVGTSRQFQAKYKYLGYGFNGAIVGSAVGLMFNDTGVIAATTCIIFPIATILMLDLMQPPLTMRLATGTDALALSETDA